MKKTEAPIAQMIDLGNGKEALNLMPELGGTAALVDLSVVKRLASMLPKANTNDIIANFASQLDELRLHSKDSSNKLAVFCDMLEAELSFHKTINLITTVEIPEQVAMPAVAH